MTLTVLEAARRTGRNPETIRRWIREGRLRASKVGTQHIIDEHDLGELIEPAPGRVMTPAEWRTTFWAHRDARCCRRPASLAAGTLVVRTDSRVRHLGAQRRVWALPIR